jgi:hypothetical protein
MLLFMIFMILFGIGLSSSQIFTKTQTHMKKNQSLLPFQNSSPIILQNIFKYLNLEDFSTIQIAYQKSKSSILQKQFLKISRTFFKKTLHDKIIFEFTLSPTKEIKFLNFFLKTNPIQFSNFINHVLIYHEFRFISYYDGSFSIEQKINNAKNYELITLQNLSDSEKYYEVQKPHIKNILRNASKQFLNFALDKAPQLYMLFKNAQISILNYKISIESENNTYFVSLDKTYVIRFFNSNFFVYHIPMGIKFSFECISWSYSIAPDFETLPEFGIFLPSCHNPKMKQIILKKKIKNGKVSEQENFSIEFQLKYQRGPDIPVDYPMCLTDNLYMDLYL